ncbi:MAG: adenylate/guanylate cyclase domain-containing protein [Candidatus Cybelea sp.]
MKNAALPSGTVAFLFSDIEGSTRRWDAHADAMRDAVRRHDEILRSEIERRRGYVFKTIGDAFCAAFWSVGEALEAAVDSQRRLGRENFADVDELRVRMAIAAGEADERSGDYFGKAVNRVARLVSAGHGGQILVSGDAADLITGGLPAGITLRQLGTIALRDLKAPERVFQAIGAELRTEFKALRTLETPPNNLPLQTTSFIGRQQDVLRIQRLLETESLVTIVGAGGMGKTRLAFEVAAAALNDGKDGTWFVDLASISDEALVISVLLSVLGVDQAKGVAPFEVLLKFLEERELLLVLDNCEHLIGEVARVAAAIISRCRYVTLLTTSREPLNIGGENVYHISGLDLDLAVRLFNERAGAASRAFAAQTKRPFVEDICRRLDGIALAIELAAARVRTIPIEKLSEHLELRVLSGGRDRQPRQQTMRALIDWSYNLLTPEEQDFMRRCAPCMGGFTLESAIALCGTDDVGTIDLVSSLVDKSLFVMDVREADGRYRLLEPIRQFAREKLEEIGETQGASQRHAQVYAAIARDGYEEWDTSPAHDWLARLENELANFRAALIWTTGEEHDLELGAAIAGDTAPIFMRLTLLSEGTHWCERALGDGALLPAAVEARLRYTLSMLYNNQGATKNALAQALAAESLYRQASDVRGLTRALSQVANQFAIGNDLDAAKPAAEASLELARELGDRRLLADVLRRCALSFSEGRADRVRAMYAESAALAQSLNLDDDAARTLQWWGVFEAKAGNYSQAAMRLTEAMRLADEELAMLVAGELACCYLLVGDRANAEPAAREALELAAKFRHPIQTPFALSYIAALAGERNASESARLIGYAEERLRIAGWHRLAYDRAMVDGLQDMLRQKLTEAELSGLFAAGAALSDEEAVARATALISSA